MPERDINVPETAEQVGHGLLEFVERAEFGSPEYQAVSDYIFLKQSEESLRLHQKNASSNAFDPARKTYWESQARISEQKIAILEFQISQNQTRIKGYQSAFIHLGIGLDEMVSIASQEAEKKYPDDREQQSFYVDKIYDGILLQAQDAINSIRETP